MEESLVASVVSDVSDRMKAEPSYAQLAVGNFIAEQPHIANFLSAKLRGETNGEVVIHAVFHAELMAECFRRAMGTPALNAVGFPDLDRVAQPDAAEALALVAPALANYLMSNVEDEASREALALVGLAFHHCSGA